MRTTTKRKSRENAALMPKGETPPHDERAERSVIGCALALLDPTVADLPARVFYKTAHQVLWETILGLKAEGSRPDPHLVLDRLRREERLSEIGGPADVLEFGEVVPTGANADAYARKVLDAWEKNQALQRMNGAAKAAYDPHTSPNEVRQRLASAAAIRGPSEIVVTTNVVQMVDEAEAALAASGRERFHRSGELVRTVDVDGRLRIGALPRESLVEDLSAAATWVRVKVTKDGEELVPALPPRDVVGALMARAAWPKLRELRGVVDCPTLRADGTVCQVAGYDVVSRVLYVPSTEFALVPERPTRAQADAALAEIDDLFDDFPFLAPSDRSAALALLLTVVGRAAINGLTPLFATRATAAGTGKTKVVDVAAAVALGLVEAPRLGQPESDEETEKQLVSLGRDGAPLALFDNLTKPLGNGVLARALTSRTFTGRLLGRNVMVDVPMPVLAASGNNMQVASDLHRRVLPIDMESDLENPEERTGFRFPELVAHAQANRPRLLVAALTVLRWWHAAGRPAPAVPLPTWGSFEAWSTAIRSPLVLLGRADPCAGVSRLRDESDPDREALGALLRAWRDVVGDRQVTVAELVTKGKHHPELRDALVAVDVRWNPELLEARNAIGQGLKQRRGRIVGGLRLERGSVVRGYTRWCVKPMEGAEVEAQPEQTEAWESDRE